MRIFDLSLPLVATTPLWSNDFAVSLALRHSLPDDPFGPEAAAWLAEAEAFDPAVLRETSPTGTYCRIVETESPLEVLRRPPPESPLEATRRSAEWQKTIAEFRETDFAKTRFVRPGERFNCPQAWDVPTRNVTLWSMIPQYSLSWLRPNKQVFQIPANEKLTYLEALLLPWLSHSRPLRKTIRRLIREWLSLYGTETPYTREDTGLLAPVTRKSTMQKESKKTHVRFVNPGKGTALSAENCRMFALWYTPGCLLHAEFFETLLDAIENPGVIPWMFQGRPT